LFLLRIIAVVIVVITVFIALYLLYCTFKIYSAIQLSQPQPCNKVSVLLKTEPFSYY